MTLYFFSEEYLVSREWFCSVALPFWKIRHRKNFNLLKVRSRVFFKEKMFFEISIICSIIFTLWIIGKLLMLFDIVHVPKKHVHIWRHVKHLNQVNGNHYLKQ